MAKSTAFVLPRGVELDLNGETFSLKHSGDVTIEETFGKPLGTVEAGGDLTIRLASVTGTLVAGGTLTIEGNVDAVSLRASKIEIAADQISARAISAEASILINGARMQVDAIVAPHIDIDAAASGRVTVIESHNERRSTKIKGGFNLSDYEDMIGGAAAFLADRGVPPISAAPVAAATKPTPAPVDPAPAVKPADPPTEKKPTTKATAAKAVAKAASNEAANAEAVDTVELAPQPAPNEDELVVLAPTMSIDDDDDEDIDDPLSLSLDDLEPLSEEGDSEAAVQARLQEALRRITACYDGPDTPPAVSELRTLVEDGDVDALSQNITSVWNGLLGFHQKRGIRPHHQVTHAFNVIHSLVS